MKKLNVELPLLHPSLEGFVLSKRYPKVYIHPGGIAANLDGEIIEPQIDKTGYLFIPGGVVHRHVAETFIPIPLHLVQSKRHVNHKNGIKIDNGQDNLEWVTPRENTLHALYTGLRPMNKPVLCKDLRTGNVEEYFSVQDMGRRFGINASKIVYALRPPRRGKVWRRYYGIVYKGQEWPDYNQEDVGSSSCGWVRDYLVRNIETGEKKIVQSLRKVSAMLGVELAALSMSLRRRAQRDLLWVRRGNFEVAYANLLPEEELRDVEVILNKWERPDLKKGFKKAWRVKVFDSINNIETVYPSLSTCCLDLKISFSTTQSTLSTHRKREVYGLMITYDL